jgi:hypothetical protein
MDGRHPLGQPLATWGARDRYRRRELGRRWLGEPAPICTLPQFERHDTLQTRLSSPAITATAGCDTHPSARDRERLERAAAPLRLQYSPFGDTSHEACRNLNLSLGWL